MDDFEVEIDPSLFDDDFDADFDEEELDNLLAELEDIEDEDWEEEEEE